MDDDTQKKKKQQSIDEDTIGEQPNFFLAPEISNEFMIDAWMHGCSEYLLPLLSWVF